MMQQFCHCSCEDRLCRSSLRVKNLTEDFVVASLLIYTVNFNADLTPLMLVMSGVAVLEVSF
jgi:hypothetical protein